MKKKEHSMFRNARFLNWTDKTSSLTDISAKWTDILPEWTDKTHFSY